MACLVLDILLLALQTLRSLICGGKSLYLIYSISMCTFSVPPMVIGSSSACPQSLRGEAWLPSADAELTGRRAIPSRKCRIRSLYFFDQDADDVENFCACVTPPRLFCATSSRVFSLLSSARSRRSSTPTAGLGSDSCRSFSCSLFRLLGCSNATSSDQSKSVAVLPRKKSLCL